MGKIILDENWDSSIKYRSDPDYQDDGKLVGFFAGRQKEVKLLSNDIARKNEGSILIRGYPGVGKTSLVQKSLHTTTAEDDQIVVVFLSGPDMLENGNLSPESMMGHLARRLYVYSKEEDLGDVNNQIETFYYKSVSKSTEKLTKDTEDFYEHQSGSETNFRAKLSSRSALEKTAWYIIPFVLGGALSIHPDLGQVPVLPVITTGVLLLTIHFGYHSYSGEKKQRHVKRRAQSTYEKDNTLGNLKFDLNKIHRELSGKRVVYVIDELDKVEFEDAINVLEFFKDFFTSSNALFIFVAGENFIPENFSGAQDTQAHRPRSYTYFNSQYFIPRPRKEDLIHYLRDITTERDDVSEEELNATYGALCFDAKNDFFDLKTMIKNRIESFEDFKPVLEPRSNDEKKSNIYNAIALFEDRYSTDLLEWEENEQIARTLFDRASSIFSGHPGQEIQDPSGDEVQDKLARDFHHYLHRHGVLDIKSTDPKQVEGVEVDINTYIIQNTDLEIAPSSIDEPTEFEREFLEKFNRICKYHLPIINLIRSSEGTELLTSEELLENPNRYLSITDSIGLNTAGAISNHTGLYKRINRRQTQDLERAKVETESDSLDSLTQNYLNNRLVDAFAKSFSQIVKDPRAKLTHLEDAQFAIDSAVFDQFENDNPLVIHNSSNPYKPKRVVIFSKKGPGVRNMLPNDIGRGENYKMVVASSSNQSHSPILTLNTESPEKLGDSVEQAVEELQTYFHSGVNQEIEDVLTRSTVNKAMSLLYTDDLELLQIALDFERKNKNRTTLMNWIGRKKRNLKKNENA